MFKVLEEKIRIVLEGESGYWPNIMLQPMAKRFRSASLAVLVRAMAKLKFRPCRELMGTPMLTFQYLTRLSSDLAIWDMLERPPYP